MNEKREKILSIKMNAECAFSDLTNALCNVAAAPEDLVNGQSVHTLTADEKDEVVTLLASAGMDLKKITELCLEIDELINLEDKNEDGQDCDCPIPVSLPQDDWNAVCKCIKAALGKEPLKEYRRDQACRIYDEINMQWHQRAGEMLN